MSDFILLSFQKELFCPIVRHGWWRANYVITSTEYIKIEMLICSVLLVKGKRGGNGQ